jgi:GPI mannosyltransferase 3
MLACCLMALLLRVGTALRSPSLVHPDEIFQTQEPAHRLAYGYGVVTWEWRLGVRSWVFPALLACIMRLTDWIDTGSTGYLLGITVVLSLTSLVTVWFGFKWAARSGDRDGALVAAAACATWYQLVIFGSRALTEVLATHLLLPGLYLGTCESNASSKRRLLAAGVLCGSAALLRIQLAPVVLFATLYFVRSNWRRQLPFLVLGELLPLCAFGIVDKVTWSHPFQSLYLYFWINVVEGRSKLYGTEPWYWLVFVLLSQLGPVAIAALLGVRRSPFLGWIALIVLVSHSAVPHKEARFLYPIFPIAITLAALGTTEMAKFVKRHVDVSLSRGASITVAILFFVCTSALYAPTFPYWSNPAGVMKVFDRLSRENTLCGIALYRVPWYESGGYTHLHRNVALIPIAERSELLRQLPAYNVIVAYEGLIDAPPNLTFDGCWNGACVYRRTGACVTTNANDDVNAVLKRTGN